MAIAVRRARRGTLASGKDGRDRRERWSYTPAKRSLSAFRKRVTRAAKHSREKKSLLSIGFPPFWNGQFPPENMKTLRVQSCTARMDQRGILLGTVAEPVQRPPSQFGCGHSMSGC
jgi:hypothetical protein